MQPLVLEEIKHTRSSKKLSRESGKEPSWNFNKFLTSKEGKLVGMYDSKVLPESLAGKIENLL